MDIDVQQSHFQMSYQFEENATKERKPRTLLVDREKSSSNW